MLVPSPPSCASPGLHQNGFPIPVAALTPIHSGLRPNQTANHAASWQQLGAWGGGGPAAGSSPNPRGQDPAGREQEGTLHHQPETTQQRGHVTGLDPVRGEGALSRATRPTQL